MNSITEFLDLEDANIIVEGISTSERTKTITISTVPIPKFCPQCLNRMHSRGIKKRKIQHPILQDGYNVILILKQRRWKCTNAICGYEANEEFRFVNARRFHCSDTHVTDIFNRYVHLSRLPLTEIISIDEVCIDMDSNCKYALVIQDFFTGDPIDLLISRRSDVKETEYLYSFMHYKELSDV